MRFLLPRRLLRTLSGLMIGVMLLAQALVAAHACEVVFTAGAASTGASAARGAASCHEAPAADAKGICVKHCVADEQSTGGSVPAVGPMPAIAVLTVPPLAPLAQMSANGIAAAHDTALATDPPPAILFHAFRS